jgi:hypothetical protein
VLILKAVKVLCFDTLLQVLILKGFSFADLLAALSKKKRLLDGQTSRTVSGRSC